MFFSLKFQRWLYSISLLVWLSIAVVSAYRFYFKRRVVNETPLQSGLVVELHCKQRGTSTVHLNHNGTRYIAFFQNKRCNNVSLGESIAFYALPKPGYALLRDESIENDLYFSLAFFGLAFGSAFFLSRTLGEKNKKKERS